MNNKPLHGAGSAGTDRSTRGINRRSALALSLLGCATWLAACGGGTPDDQLGAAVPGVSPGPAPAPSTSPSTSPAPAAAEAWNVGPLYFAAGSGATLDLAATLPNGVQRGGTFGTSPAGAPLPVGMALSAAGILSIGAATVGDVNGVVFTYSEPA